jgi:hypothetical protein
MFWVLFFVESAPFTFFLPLFEPLKYGVDCINNAITHISLQSDSKAGIRSN